MEENQTKDSNLGIYKKDIIKFLTGQAISLFGSFLVQYAIIWYITLETKSGVMATISVLVGFLPQVVISLFAGVWADRYNKKNLIMYSDGMIAVSTIILAIIFVFGIRNIWLIFLMLGIRSLGSGVQMPAVSSFIPCITPEDKLMKVNGIYSIVQSIMMIITPIASGALLAASKIDNIYKLEYIFLIDVFTAIIGISLLYTVKYKYEEKSVSENQNQFTELKEGLVYLKEHKVIRRILEYYAIISFLFSPIAFLTTLMVTRTFGDEVWRLTLHESVFGAGSVIGGIIISVWGGFKNRINTIILSCFIFGVISVAIGFSKVFLIYLIIMGFAGIIIPFFNTPTMVFFQENVEQKLQGRVFSFLGIVTTTAMPLGMLLLGPLADIISIESILIITGILIMIICTFAYFDKILKNSFNDSEEKITNNK